MQFTKFTSKKSAQEACDRLGNGWEWDCFSDERDADDEQIVIYFVCKQDEHGIWHYA